MTGNPRFIFFAVLTVLFPLVLALGIVLIPVVRNYADHELAEAAAAKSKRWFWGHLLSAVGFGLGVVVSAVINLYLLWSINRFWASFGLVLMIVGGAAQMFGLGADGIGPLAVRRAGGSAKLFFDGSRVWVTGTFIVGSILFSLGQIIMVILVGNRGVFLSAMTITMLVAAILFSLSTAVPSGYGLYVTAVTAFIIYLPLAGLFWQLASI
jgi:hypothetical protein